MCKFNKNNWSFLIISIKNNVYNGGIVVFVF